MDFALSGILFERALVYMDDLICPGKSEEHALENLRAVFQRLREANLKLKPSKCSLFQSQCTFLGHVVTREGTRCDPQKVEAIENWATPTCVSEVRSWLGVCSYYRAYVPGFAEIAAPLTNWTRKNQKFVWDDRCQAAFEKLKVALVSAPVLAYPNGTDPFILDTDASAGSIGAVLSQVQNGEEKVIAYASSALSKSRRNYCTTYRELYAVVTFVKHFKHYLWGRKFLVRTDHSSLKWLRNFKEPEGMVARWIATLETYDLQIEHRKGSLHGNADGLSRVPRKCCQRDECDGCRQKYVKVVTRSQARGHGPATDGAAKGRDEATEGRRGERIEVDHMAQSNSASANEDAEGSARSSAPASDMQGDDREALTELGFEGSERTQTDAGTEVEVGDSKSDGVPVVPSSVTSKSNWFPGWSREELRTLQKKDPVTSALLALKEKDEKPPKSEVSKYSMAIRTLIAQWDNLRVVDGLLYIVSKQVGVGDETPLLVAPSEIRQEVLRISHDLVTSV